MTDLTLIYFDYGLYNLNKLEVKKIIFDNGLIWDNNKVKLSLDNDIIISVYKQFCLYDKISTDKNLIGKSGSIGIWSNSNFAIKIIIFDETDKVKNYPVLLVLKGKSNTLIYTSLIEYCVRIGCTISKIVEVNGLYEEVFRRRLNVDLIILLNDNKNVLIQNVEDHSNKLFSEKWKEYIIKYGQYSYDDLKLEIESMNVLPDDNDKVKIVKIKPKYSKFNRIVK